MMRYLFGVLCVCALGVVPLVGCSDTTGDGGTGGTAGTGGAAGTGGTAGIGGAAGTGGSGGFGGGEAPVITRVQWNWEQNCMVGVSTEVTVAVFATDDDTDPESLAYSGDVSDCTPDIDADVSILDCTTDHIGLRFGTVTVADPQENSDTVTFTFDPCQSGEVCEGGEPCP